jgi:hypothetical protein
VFVYHGSSRGVERFESAPARELTSEASERFESIAGAGDVNGDGFADVLVGSPLSSSVQVYFGSSSGIAATPALVLRGASEDRFGYSAASAGDVNGDGFADIVVGSPTPPTNRGRVSVFHGSATGIAVSAARVLEGAEGDGTGYTMAGAGDVNGDGFADIIVGAHLATVRGLGTAGTTSVYHGSAAGIAGTPSRVLELAGAEVNDLFGMAVAGAGDINGDGFSDIVVGAPAAGTQGRCAVHLGSSGGISSVAQRILEGEAADTYGNLGSRVAAGDLNADGYSDVIVSSPSASLGSMINVGRVNVYFGRPEGVRMTPDRVIRPYEPGMSGANHLFGSGLASGTR